MQDRKKAPLTPAIEEWRRQSPIRRWLESSPDRKTAVARRKRLKEELQVNRIMLYYWMHGQALPRTEKFVRICAIIGVSQKTYLKWFNDYPTPTEASESWDGVPAASL